MEKATEDLLDAVRDLYRHTPDTDKIASVLVYAHGTKYEHLAATICSKLISIDIDIRHLIREIKENDNDN